MNQHEQMRSARILPLLVRYSIPTTIGMVINALYNVIDRIFIGNHPELGSLGLAAITVAFPIIMLFSAFAFMFGIGGATNYSISLGERNNSKSNLIVNNAFLLTISVTILLSIIVLLYLDNIINFLQIPTNVIPYTKQYLSVIVFAMVFQSINMTGNNLIRADGSPKVAMISFIIGGVTNVILDYVFIYIFDMGMVGAALATNIGLLLTSIWIIFYFTKGSSTIKLKYTKLKFYIVYQIIATGLPTFIINISGSIVQIALISVLALYGGDLAVSAMGIVSTIAYFLLLPILGISHAAVPIIAFNFGAKQYDRVFQTLKLSIIIGSIISIFGFIITRLFTYQMIIVFNSNPDLVTIATPYIHNWFIAMPTFAVMLLTSNFFQAIKKVYAATFFSLLRQLVLLLPLAYYLAPIYGVDGISIANPIAEIITTILSLTYLLYTYKSITRTQN